MEEQALARIDPTAEFMPLMTIEQATDRYKSIVQYVKTLLHEGTDFGKIPGTDKNVLLKPGAEKLCTLFGLTPSYDLMNCIEDWTGAQNGSPFFYYRYKCTLTRHGMFIADSEASANSHESKYRWRKGERLCPTCGKPSIIKGKADYGGGWLCWTKKDGCGAKFFDGDETIESQNVDRVPNPDIADQVNTLQKMSQKRALLSACLLAVNASEFFTVDLEDFADVQQEAKEEVKAQVPQNNGAEARVRGELFNQVKKDGKSLNDLGDSTKWTTATLNGFANENFNTTGGVQGLSVSQLAELENLLNARIVSLTPKKAKTEPEDRAEVERKARLAKIQTSPPAAVAQAMKETYPDKAIEQLTLDELLRLEEEIIPF